MTSPSADPKPAAADASVPPDGESAGVAAAATEPVPPEQSREDTDAAWGEYSEPADDRLDRDRPPHWDDY